MNIIKEKTVMGKNITFEHDRGKLDYTGVWVLRDCVCMLAMAFPVEN